MANSGLQVEPVSDEKCCVGREANQAKGQQDTAVICPGQAPANRYLGAEESVRLEDKQRHHKDERLVEKILNAPAYTVVELVPMDKDHFGQDFKTADGKITAPARPAGVAKAVG